MIAFASMLIEAAVDAGIKVPTGVELDTIDSLEFDPETYPHFLVFCLAQLARPVAFHGEHWDNAKVIASIPEDQIRTVSVDDLVEKGFSYPLI